MVAKRGVLGVAGAPNVGGDPLAPGEDLHGSGRQAHLHLGASMAVGDRVEVAVRFDMIVEPDLAHAPDRQDVGLRRRRLQPGLVQFLEQLAAGAADIAENPLIVQAHQ